MLDGGSDRDTPKLPARPGSLKAASCPPHARWPNLEMDANPIPSFHSQRPAEAHRTHVAFRTRSSRTLSARGCSCGEAATRVPQSQGPGTTRSSCVLEPRNQGFSGFVDSHSTPGRAVTLLHRATGTDAGWVMRDDRGAGSRIQDPSPGGLSPSLRDPLDA
ncbi:hypothetical protein L226DRAFT_68463 [Lentinus tigrinus ALCF2SS1-7]|uniref:Uncharacterized protein n=1 Tax=Lentinus tigrinus ALCF2SS1-6 TaxID=1328759 RepID=A0A5C2SAB2_9APHY|nr:hypothetical protein L227DRAFT_109725 [Lentinus tigrinus ALCF2SS1-6]RPD74914.1 hypothetical protein L226DRAFT_68463 [Lentinus tigrinus ALCF2SS1-7]